MKPHYRPIFNLIIVFFFIAVAIGCTSQKEPNPVKTQSPIADKSMQEVLLETMADIELWATFLGNVDFTSEAWQEFENDEEKKGVIIHLLLQAMPEKQDKKFIKQYSQSLIAQTPHKMTLNIVDYYKKLSKEMEMEMSKTNINEVDTKRLDSLNHQSGIMRIACQALVQVYLEGKND